MSRKARDMGHPRRSFAYGNVKIENDSITGEFHRVAEGLEERLAGDLPLAGRAGLRCLNLFSGLMARLKSCSFHESGFTAVSPPTLFRKVREKRVGHPASRWTQGSSTSLGMRQVKTECT